MEDSSLLEFNLSDFGLLRVKEQIVLDGNANDINTADSPNTVLPRNISATEINGEKITCELPKMSWNVIRFEKVI